MHELAVCQALLDAVEMRAAAHWPARPARITVKIGPLSGVVPELLQQAYELARAGTTVAAATLVVESADIRVYCSVCERETQARPNRLVCGHCGNWRTRLCAGDELILQSIEFDETSRQDSAAA